MITTTAATTGTATTTAIPDDEPLDPASPRPLPPEPRLVKEPEDAIVLYSELLRVRKRCGFEMMEYDIIAVSDLNVIRCSISILGYSCAKK